MYVGRHVSWLIITESTAQLNNALGAIGIEVLVGNLMWVIFKHDADKNGGEIGWKGENAARYTFYIAEEKLHECCRVLVKIGEESSAVLDTRFELTLMKESLYEKIK